MVEARVTLFLHFLTGVFISAIYVPFPKLVPDILFFLIKRMNRLIGNELSDSESVCGSVQSDGGDARSVVEENDGTYGESGSKEESKGFIEIDQSEPDEGSVTESS